jgi:SprT-like protein
MNFAQQFALKYWNRTFDIEIELVNRDWKSMAGCYIRYKDGRKIIRMSKIKNKRLSDLEVLGTLKHEMVHWVLDITNKNFSDESKDFVEECIRVGAPFSKTASAQKAFGEYVQKNLYDYFDTLKKPQT